MGHKIKKKKKDKEKWMGGV